MHGARTHSPASERTCGLHTLFPPQETFTTNSRNCSVMSRANSERLDTVLDPAAGWKVCSGLKYKHHTNDRKCDKKKLKENGKHQRPLPPSQTVNESTSLRLPSPRVQGISASIQSRLCPCCRQCIATTLPRLISYSLVLHHLGTQNLHY